MPPWAGWWRGRETVARFAEHAAEICATARAIPVRANGQLAVAYFALQDETGRYAATAIDVVTLEGELIKEITAFVTPEVFPRFGLPIELDPA
jgi:RNA polymerase sigma-70 factor (ECF subfamily)